MEMPFHLPLPLARAVPVTRSAVDTILPHLAAPFADTAFVSQQQMTTTATMTTSDRTRNEVSSWMCYYYLRHCLPACCSPWRWCGRVTHYTHSTHYLHMCTIRSALSAATERTNERAPSTVHIAAKLANSHPADDGSTIASSEALFWLRKRHSGAQASSPRVHIFPIHDTIMDIIFNSKLPRQSYSSPSACLHSCPFWNKLKAIYSPNNWNWRFLLHGALILSMGMYIKMTTTEAGIPTIPLQFRFSWATLGDRRRKLLLC